MRTGPTQYEATVIVRFWFDKSPTSSIVDVMDAALSNVQEAIESGNLEGDDFCVRQIEPFTN